ncbi:hypothetical protein UU5_18217 [Rhodanobacter sp. 115]|nr:hypothetical protein UU5_18217 [Rhodanobacter sp. 115]
MHSQDATHAIGAPEQFLVEVSEITVTRAWLASSPELQPEPYWNGTSNIWKKSDEVESMLSISGGWLPSGTRTFTALAVMIAWRSARCAFHRSVAER